MFYKGIAEHTLVAALMRGEQKRHTANDTRLRGP